jgi:hypothetical protein
MQGKKQFVNTIWNVQKDAMQKQHQQNTNADNRRQGGIRNVKFLTAF